MVNVNPNDARDEYFGRGVGLGGKALLRSGWRSQAGAENKAVIRQKNQQEGYGIVQLKHTRRRHEADQHLDIRILRPTCGAVSSVGLVVAVPWPSSGKRAGRQATRQYME